jgi:hypothetical protein
MSERIHVLAQQLFGKASVDECDLQEIRDLANRHPYFAPAQFLLLEKLKKEASPEYSSQLQKAVLYYHNPLEFEYFISSERFETEIDFEESDQLSAVSYDQENSVDTDLLSTQTDIVEAEPNDVTINIEEQNHEIAPIEISEPSKELFEENTDSETELENEVDESETSSTDHQMTEAIERVLQQEEEQIKEPVPDQNNNAIVFEPYHTVDYFASQGIKLSQDETGKDKFGRQLKSFTEWLKTMKRLPSTQLTQNMDAGSESKVQHLAEDSVHQADVVTEAMAEVWVKQGNKQKALETYNKLSLLNPSKKAYFAALIDNLKRS